MSDPKPVFKGDWANATGVEKGRHSQRVREWKARQPKSETGLVEPSDERDRALALRTARSIARNPNARDADKLTAAKLLAGIEEVQATKPPSIERLEALSSAERQKLIATLL